MLQDIDSSAPFEHKGRKSTGAALVELIGGGISLPISDVAAVTTVPVVATAGGTQLLAANASRLGAKFYNAGAVSVFLILGTQTPTTSLYTVELVSKAYWNLEGGFIGVVKAIAASGTQNVNVTEIT